MSSAEFVPSTVSDKKKKHKNFTREVTHFTKEGKLPLPLLPILQKQTDLDLHCLLFSMWICINNLDQVIRQLKVGVASYHSLFSMTKVN